MMFCPKCGSILIVKEVNKKRVLACSCGYKSSDSDFTLSEKVEKKQDVEVVERDDAAAYPLVDADCPECKHKKARHWTIQTRSSDEPATNFFRCDKCKHTWRDYS